MARQRFTAATYVRRLKTMEDDLWWWEASYRDAASRSVVYDVRERRTERANVLADARYQLLKARETLSAVPRLS